jgi:hypothetical protein
LILCEECYKDKEGPGYLPATMGRGTCEECGTIVQDAYELEDEEDED